MEDLEVVPVKELCPDEVEKLEQQNSRGLLNNFQQSKLEKEAAKNWDKFYKRNGDRFFKDRHWTTREFVELLKGADRTLTLFEVGCGVGNFFFPLLESGLKFKVHACDFSARAIGIVKEHALFDAQNINAFVCDITSDIPIEANSVDIVSLVFVLSAILPTNFENVINKLFQVLRPNGKLLFRDYAVNDMAMIRFSPGTKLEDRLYVRQDGTRAYYFTVEELTDLFTKCGFKVVEKNYVSRRTVNVKEGVDAERRFVQAKLKK